MKKFEEEFDKNVDVFHVIGHHNGMCCSADKAKAFGHGWVSPEDHQAEVGKIELQNLKYREEIARMQKSLRKKNKAIKELNGAVKKSKARLKECEDLRIEANNSAAMEYSRKCEVVEERAELKRENQRLRAENLAVKTLVEDAKKQQPALPEVPQFVADWYEENKDSLDYMIYETCANLKHKSTDKFEQWFGEAKNNSITTLIHMKNGYTVAKEKRFYLKNKVTELYLYKAFGGKYGEEYPTGFSESFQFTQQEIDSMAAESYEQIEVEE